MDDQLLAGVIMKVGGMLIALAAIAVSFYKWYQQGDDRVVGSSK
jgi:cytochrome c oxidase assembly factor CtaG